MINAILRASLHGRMLVLVAAGLLMIYGLWTTTRCRSTSSQISTGRR